MISRYKTTAMTAIWDELTKYKLWKEFQLLICQAWTELKVIPEPDFVNIKTHLNFNLEQMAEIEMEVKHDVVAFTTMLGANLGAEKKWLHFGITSTDMVDSVLNYQIKQANLIIATKLEKICDILKTLALQYKTQLIIGRTHGIFAEPTSFGFKMALWYAEMLRQKKRFSLAQNDLNVIKVNGSMGNYAHVDPFVAEFLAEKWGMTVDVATTQVVQRDRHLFLMQTLTGIGNTIEKIALEIRNSQRSEVNELQEGFEQKQKGSSSMPHKKNPIGSENLTSLARVMRNFVMTAYDNNLLWYERDLTHSASDRIVFPDVYHLLDFCLDRLQNILQHLVINTTAMAENIAKANEIYYSQSILHALIRKHDTLSREAAYKLVQACATKSLAEDKAFPTVFVELYAEKYLTTAELAQICDVQYFMRNLDYSFKKIFAL